MVTITGTTLDPIALYESNNGYARVGNKRRRCRANVKQAFYEKTLLGLCFKIEKRREKSTMLHSPMGYWWEQKNMNATAGLSWLLHHSNSRKEGSTLLYYRTSRHQQKPHYKSHCYIGPHINYLLQWQSFGWACRWVLSIGTQDAQPLALWLCGSCAHDGWEKGPWNEVVTQVLRETYPFIDIGQSSWILQVTEIWHSKITL